MSHGPCVGEGSDWTRVLLYIYRRIYGKHVVLGSSHGDQVSCKIWRLFAVAMVAALAS
jgi:hypothetical protein